MEDVLFAEIEKLRKENEQLKSAKSGLEERLAAKRYRLTDAVVDGAYSAVRKLRAQPRKEAVVSNNAETQSNYDIIGAEPVERKPVRGRVDIVNYNFYDWDGKTVFKGGAERYVFDLATLLKEMGFSPRILQGANKDFTREYHGLEVVGVKVEGADPLKLGETYDRFCSDAEFIIASPDILCAGITHIPCIGINHGVVFDTPQARILRTLPERLVNPFKFLREALENLTIDVCVDTNFVNLMRTRDWELSRKLTFVPNYYDATTFQELPSTQHKDDEIVFIFPRRVMRARGYSITLRAFAEVLKKYPRVKLRLIGQIQEGRAQRAVEKYVEKFPENISHSEFAMEDAQKIYQDADVVLIPTVFSEGTSLSCIEAQASGLPVIATNVGGLPNLIIDHFNGLLVSPTAKALENAMIECIENPSLRRRLGENAAEVAKSAFEKKLWKERWSKIIDGCVEKTRKR